MGLYARHIFPRLLEWAMSCSAKKQARAELLRHAGGKVLEIGFGTGLNLEHYPPEVREITTVEVNPGMSKLAARRIAASGRNVQQHLITAEQLPLADDTFDTVVSAWTLCSIPDVHQALREVRRVLKPGGKLLFIEHGLADTPRLRRWQHRLNPINRRIGCGCNLDRDIRGLIESHFEIEQIRQYYMDSVPRLGGYMYEGIARKREPLTPRS